jgi:hypothetical protein
MAIAGDADDGMAAESQKRSQRQVSGGHTVLLLNRMH